MVGVVNWRKTKIRNCEAVETHLLVLFNWLRQRVVQGPPPPPPSWLVGQLFPLIVKWKE